MIRLSLRIQFLPLTSRSSLPTQWSDRQKSMSPFSQHGIIRRHHKIFSLYKSERNYNINLKIAIKTCFKQQLVQFLGKTIHMENHRATSTYHMRDAFFA